MPAPRFPFTAYPSGWFVVATTEDLPPNALLPLRYFGRDLIAFRDASNIPTVLDAYCPHLGAHFAHGGKIEGNCIRCPFHGWKFDAEGTCVEIPYADRIPPKARLTAWPTLEQDGLIFVFHGRPGERPWPLPPLETERYTAGKMVHWRNLATHPQEIFENTVDITHIGPVHDGRNARMLGRPERDGPHLHINLEFLASGELVGMPDQINDVHLDVSLHGLGVVIVETHVRNVDVRARQRLYATPVDETHIDLRGIVHIVKTEDPEFTEELAELFFRAYVSDFAKDFPIWENKRYLIRPTLARGDGPIGIYRRWCTQFYDDPLPTTVEPEPEPELELEPEPEPRLPSAAPTLLLHRVSQLVPERVREATKHALTRASERVPWLTALTDNLPSPPSPPSPQTQHDDWTPETSTPPATAPSPEPPPTTTPKVASAREYFETLPQRFVPTAARGVDAVYQWELSGADGRVFHAVVRDGALAVHDGPHQAPTVTLIMNADDYVKVVNGELDGMKAFTSGKGKVRGNVRAAMKMRSLFPAA